MKVIGGIVLAIVLAMIVGALESISSFLWMIGVMVSICIMLIYIGSCSNDEG